VRDAESPFAESPRNAGIVGVGLAVAFFLILLGLFGARQAHAEITHKFDSNLFPGTLSNPTSLAVDQATGDIVVLDGSKLFKFTAAGAPSNFSALAKNELLPGCGSECANVAIDNSGGVNQGVIYVSSNEASSVGGERQVRVFLPSGEKADSIRNWSTGERPHSFCGVATDPKGQVYVGHVAAYEANQIPGGKADGTSYIDKLKPGAWVPEANEQKLVWPIQVTMLGLSPDPNGGACRVAANSNEDLYYSFYSTYGEVVVPIKRSPHTAYGAVPGPPVVVVESAASAFTVDHTTDDLYSNRKTEIARFDSNNNLRERFGSTAGQLEEESFGVAINEVNGTVYATNRLTDKISVFKAYVTPDVAYNASTPLQTTAGVSGKVGLAAAGNVTDCVVEYGTDTQYLASPVKCTPDASGTPFSSEKEVTASLIGLNKETLYHYRISATNANGTTRGIDQTFTTHNVAGVTTGDATDVTQSSATLNGSFSGNGEATSIKFQWGPTTSYANETTPQAVGTPNVATNVSAPITGLAVYTPETGTYHYRLVATNGSGSTFGPDRVFHAAPPTLPTIGNTESSALTETGATLSTEVNPGKGATSVVFEYGTGLEYGSVTLPSESIGNDETNHPVTAELTGLAPGTTYHFRVVASNFGGTTQGADQTFTTGAPVEPPVEPPLTPPNTTPLNTNPPATGDCDALSRRASKESKEAARLRNSAKEASSPKRASSLRKKASKRAKKAKQLNKQATACRAGGNG
jgi:hypothetical protein